MSVRTPRNVAQEIRRRARFAVLIAVFAFSLALSPQPAGALPAFPNSSGGLRITQKLGSGQIIPDLASAVAIAKSHAILVISQGWQLGYPNGSWDQTVKGTYWDEMMSANPNLMIFRYLSAVYGMKSTFPESWYLHDSAAHRLWNASYKTYLMDPRSTANYVENGVTSAGWVSYLVNMYKADVAKFPGVFNGGAWFDEVGGQPNMTDAVTGAAAVPIDPTTGKPFTTQSWYNLTTSVVTRFQTAAGGWRTGNALLSAYCYYTGCGSPVPTSWFFSSNSLEESMAEGWLRNWWDAPSKFYTATDWKQSVQMLIDANAAGRAVQVVTALPTSASAAQIDQWRLYSWATYLIGNNGKSYFEFAPYGGSQWEMNNSLYTLDIGSPSTNATNASSYAKSGWYERQYTKGKVLLNPNTTAVTVPLGGTYLLPSGASVTSVTLGPNSGQVLRLSGGSPSPPPPSSSGNLLSNGSFEGSLSGWSPISSYLSSASDGTTGAGAAKVARANYDTYGLIASPAPISTASAGTYLGSGYVRSAASGKHVCLVLREKTTSGSLLYGTSCITTSTGWQAFPLVTKNVAAGSLVDVYVYASGSVAGDSFEVDGLQLTRSNPNLLSNGSFEGSLSGWGLMSSSLSLASDGTSGSGAAKVTRVNYATYGLIASPAPVSSAGAGVTYIGSGWVRSATPGKQVCLVLREKRTDGTLLYATSCLTSTSTWQQFPLVTKSLSGGSLLDLYVYQSGAVAGNSFEVDGLQLQQR